MSTYLPKDWVTQWLSTTASTVAELKIVESNLPLGRSRDELAANIQRIENLVGKADAELAHALGMKLCDCDWPPKIMRWVEVLQSHVCPDPMCGRRIEKPSPVEIARRRSMRRVADNTDFDVFTGKPFSSD